MAAKTSRRRNVARHPRITEGAEMVAGAAETTSVSGERSTMGDEPAPSTRDGARAAVRRRLRAIDRRLARAAGHHPRQ